MFYGQRQFSRQEDDKMIGKQLRVGLMVVLLVVSIVGGGATSSVLAADGDEDDTRGNATTIDVGGAVNVAIGSNQSNDSDSDSDDSRSSATEIGVGDTVEGTIGSENDSDWYAVDLSAGQGLTAELVHTNREDPSTELTFDLYNPNGDSIGEVPFDRPINAYQTSPASNIAFGGDVVEQSGTHYIRVEGVTGGEYSLTVDTESLDQNDPNEQPDTATSIESGDTVTGTLTGYDRDLYSLNLEQGENVTITSDASGSQSLWVADSSVSSPMSEEYYFEDSVANADSMGGTLSFTANQTGTYYLKVVTNAEKSTASTFFENNPYEMTIDVLDQNDSTDTPTDTPTEKPTQQPTDDQTDESTDTPTEEPTEQPTEEPTDESTDTPTEEPTEQPTEEPTDESTDTPVDEPVDKSTDTPVDEPVDRSTDIPTEQPTDESTDTPTEKPTEQPTDESTDAPTEKPTDDSTDDSNTDSTTETPTEDNTDNTNNSGDNTPETSTEDNTDSTDDSNTENTTETATEGTTDTTDDSNEPPC